MKTSELQDRELLELAARAVGLNAEWHNLDNADYDAEHDGLWLKGERTPDNDSYWNPLRNDGDALRLAVKLHMIIEPMKTMGGKWVEVSAYPSGRGDCQASEPTRDDPCAATRRAIVRAAAAIGAQMP